MFAPVIMEATTSASPLQQPSGAALESSPRRRRPRNRTARREDGQQQQQQREEAQTQTLPPLATSQRGRGGRGRGRGRGRGHGAGGPADHAAAPAAAAVSPSQPLIPRGRGGLRNQSRFPIRSVGGRQFGGQLTVSENATPAGPAQVRPHCSTLDNVLTLLVIKPSTRCSSLRAWSAYRPEETTTATQASGPEVDSPRYSDQNT